MTAGCDSSPTTAVNDGDVAEAAEPTKKPSSVQIQEPTEEATPETAETARPSDRVESFTSKTVWDLGIEAVGCWFHDTGSDEFIFFANSTGALMAIDGEFRSMQVAARSRAIAPFDMASAYTDGSYVVSFSNVGEPVNATIESTAQVATLYLNEFGDSFHFAIVNGELVCGV